MKKKKKEFNEKDIDSKTLVEMVRTPRKEWDFMIIDVREDDYCGHKIRGAYHIPAGSFKSKQMGTLLAALEDNKKKKVIFHCYYSQVRGPRSAKMFCLHLEDQTQETGKDYDIEVFVLSGGYNRFKYDFFDTKHMDCFEKI